MEYVWLAVALAMLIAVLWRPFNKHVLGALDARSQRIRDHLAEAERLHAEAEALRDRYERLLVQGEAEAMALLDRAEAERVRLEKRMLAEYTTVTERRMRQAEERIAQEETRALAMVRSRAAELVVGATRSLLAQHLTGPDAVAAIEAAVTEASGKLTRH